MVLLLLLAAAERLPLFVSYQAPPECPDQTRFEAELRVRTSKVELVSREEAQTTLAISITRVKKQFRGTSSLHGAREFKGSRCETVAAALSLATALLLDPEARSGPVTPEELAAVPPAPAPVAAPAPTPEPAPEPAPRPAPEPPPAPAVGPAPVVSRAAEPPAPAPARPTWRGAVLVGAGVTTWVSSAVEPALELRLGLRRGHFAAQLSGLFSFGRTVSSPNGDARYRTFGARLELGPAFDLGPIELLPAAQVAVLFVPIFSPSAEEARLATSVLVAPGAGLHAALALGAWRISLDGGLGLHARRESYRVTNAGTVFTVPLAFGFGGLSLGRSFP